LNTKLVTAGGTVLGMAVGAAAGYLVAMKRLEMKFARLAEEEINAMEEYYDKKYKVGPYETPQQVLQQRHPEHVLSKDEMAEPAEDEPSIEVVEKLLGGLKYATPPQGIVKSNVFTRKVPVSDGKEEPFLISEDEYMAGELNYAQVTVTYYVADDVLTDERDMPMDDVDRTVGQENLDKFGQKSSDPNTAYVRNHRLEIDYEIVRDRGSYAKAIGLDDEPKRKPGRMPRE